MITLPSLFTNCLVIHVTLTLNSSTLYTYENPQLVHLVNNLHCLEIVGQELGVINALKTLVGSIPVLLLFGQMLLKLMLYFMKKIQNTGDGCSDLITMVVIAHVNVNKALVLTVMKNIIEKYLGFRLMANNNKQQLGEFKMYMNQIIKFEEMNYDLNQAHYNYGTTSDGTVTPNQLVLADEEVNEVRELMLDNINKILDRGDKIDSLVDQTAQLSSLLVVFKKRAQQIKRHMWTAKMKFTLAVLAAFVMLLYILIGAECGYPFFNHCI